MKNLQNSVYHLIKKLSKSEKRYFRLMSNLQEGEKQYLTLFDIIVDYPIEEQSTRQIEEDIVKQLEGVIPKKRFSAVKQYLLKQLLQMLRTLYRKHSVDGLILQNLMDREVLLAKDLDRMARNKLKNARKEAEKNERYYLLLHILDLELQYTTQRTGSLQDLKNLHNIKARVFKNLELEGQYQSIHQEAFILYKTKRSRKKEYLDRVNELLNHKLLQNIGDAKTFEAQISAYSAKAILFMMTNNIPSSNAAFRKIIEIMEAYPMMKKLYPRRYFVFLSNYLQSCHRLGKYDEFLGIWEKMGAIKPKNEDGKYEFKLKTAQSKLQIYLNTGNLQAARAAAIEVSEVIDVYSATSESFRKTRVAGSWFNLAMYHFLVGDFEKARSIFESLDTKRSNVRTDIESISQIFELLCWRELVQEEEFLSYLNLRTKRKLKRKEGLFKFERDFLSLLARIGRLPDESSKEKYFRRFLEKQMSQLKNDPTKIAGKEEIRLWIKSKLEKKPMIEVFLSELNRR